MAAACSAGKQDSQSRIHVEKGNTSAQEDGAEEASAWCDVVRKKKKRGPENGKPTEQSEAGGQLDPDGQGEGGKGKSGSSGGKGRSKGYATGAAEKKAEPPWRSGHALTAPVPPSPSSPTASTTPSAGAASPSKSKGKPKEKSKEPSQADVNAGGAKPLKPKKEIEAELHVLLEKNTKLQKNDFDRQCRQFLHAIYDKGGMAKVKEVLQLVNDSTKSKDRQAVKNWTGYVSKLLRKFFYDLRDDKGPGELGAEVLQEEGTATGEMIPLPQEDSGDWSDNSEEPVSEEKKEHKRTHSSSSTTDTADEPSPPAVPTAWMPSFRPGGMANATKLTSF